MFSMSVLVVLTFPSVILWRRVGNAFGVPYNFVSKMA